MPVSEITEVFLPKELKLLSTKRFKQGHIWEVEKVRQSFEICPKCASASNTRCGKVSVTIRDEPVRGDGGFGFASTNIDIFVRPVKNRLRKVFPESGHEEEPRSGSESISENCARISQI